MLVENFLKMLSISLLIATAKTDLLPNDYALLGRFQRTLQVVEQVVLSMDYSLISLPFFIFFYHFFFHIKKINQDKADSVHNSQPESKAVKKNQLMSNVFLFLI